MTTTTRPAKKISPNRGAKIFIGTLSLAATLSGWAWLTLAQGAEAEAFTEPLPVTDALNVPTAPLLNVPMTNSLPVLADLPLRGLRVVGAAQQAIPVQAQVPQGNDGNGQAVAPQPQPPQPAPAPRPQPVRKTQSSR